MERLVPVKKPDQGQDLDLIVLGRAGMDLYPDPPGVKIADATRFVSDLGGSAGNIAVAAARHGLAVGLIAPVSEDPAGHFVCNKVASYGIEHLTPRPALGGSRTSLALAESRATNCEVVIYRNDAADFQISEQNFNLAQIDRAPILIVTGTALAQEPSRSATLAAMARAQCCVLDLDYRAYSWANNQDTAQTYDAACDLADIIVGNDEEFDMIAPGGGQDWAKQTAKTKRLVVYKMGARGSISFQGNEQVENGIFPVEMLKPFGAGDSFMGGMIASLIRGCGPRESVEFGSAAAAMVVSRVGCASAMPTTAQVSDFIASFQET